MKIIKRYFGRKNALARINFNQFYITGRCNHVAEYIKRNSHIADVKAILSQVKSTKNDYLAKMKKFTDDESIYENKVYTRYKTVHMCKLVSRAIVILTLLFLFLQEHLPSNTFFHLISLLNYTLFRGCIVMWVITKIMEIIYSKWYLSYTKKIEAKIESINGEYDNTLSRLYDKADRLVINSLSPAEREMLLLQREQEMQRRQEHQERMRIERQKIQSQQKANQMQEELLEIERDRERRAGYYR